MTMLLLSSKAYISLIPKVNEISPDFLVSIKWFLTSDWPNAYMLLNVWCNMWNTLVKLNWNFFWTTNLILRDLAFNMNLFRSNLIENVILDIVWFYGKNLWNPQSELLFNVVTSMVNHSDSIIVLGYFNVPYGLWKTIDYYIIPFCTRLYFNEFLKK